MLIYLIIIRAVTGWSLSFPDLTIVEAKLNTRAYHKLNDFVKDVTKIFDNCRLYNPVDTAYFQCAEVVETYFAQRIKALRSANKL